MNIFNAGSLEVYAGTTSIWSLSGNQGNQWQSAEIETSDLDNQQVSRTIYWLVHAFIAPSQGEAEGPNCGCEKSIYQ